MKWRWALAAVPLLLGIAISVWMNATDRAPLYQITVDAGTLFLLLGLLISLALFIVLACRAYEEKGRREAELLAAEERRRFLFRLDHELKNPLTAILAGLANIGSADSGKSSQLALASVDAQAQRLRRLVGDLRKLSDLETRELEREPVNMTELLEEVFALVEANPDSDGRELTLSIPRAPWPLPTVFGDRDLLFLAVYNVLDNARKFTQPGDTIELRAAENERTVVIEVADTGPGIPADEIPRVWDELFRGKSAQATAGSGLGLPLVRAIVVRHGGTVAIRSRPNQGTSVTLQLPAGNE